MVFGEPARAVSLPSGDTLNPAMLLVPVFVAKASFPSLVTITQHGAVPPVLIDAAIGGQRTVPRERIRSDGALRLRNDRLVMRRDVEAERGAAARRAHHRRAQATVVFDTEHLQPIAHALGHNELAGRPA